MTSTTLRRRGLRATAILTGALAFGGVAGTASALTPATTPAAACVGLTGAERGQCTATVAQDPEVLAAGVVNVRPLSDGTATFDVLVTGAEPGALLFLFAAYETADGAPTGDGFNTSVFPGTAGTAQASAPAPVDCGQTVLVRVYDAGTNYLGGYRDVVDC
ncbi:hypothetical protein SAMN05660657_03197 [Geodermatophilus amargosae]|uniref:Secreted protein n=1 Tax=Geodermatophilus amargosae TaxID=1296565 RepID=A0A1I7B0C5_9ACTN|nr:hypothetical protein [Geodermatophilus amargosae]SFT80544.1 hypothetical protein SAMN05660657_03197 [Geodermatophilus amargosae]